MDTMSMPPREDLMKRAKDIIDSSPLDESDKNMWHERFEKLEDASIILFIDMMTVEPDLLEVVTDNVKKKVDAGRDSQKIKTIVEEEREMLQAAFSV